MDEGIEYYHIVAVDATESHLCLLLLLLHAFLFTCSSHHQPRRRGCPTAALPLAFPARRDVAAVAVIAARPCCGRSSHGRSARHRNRGSSRVELRRRRLAGGEGSSRTDATPVLRRLNVSRTSGRLPRPGPPPIVSGRRRRRVQKCHRSGTRRCARHLALCRERAGRRRVRRAVSRCEAEDRLYGGGHRVLRVPRRVIANLSAYRQRGESVCASLLTYA